MKKELTGLLFLFSVILVLLSLFSYSPADPSVANTPFTVPDKVDNLFGMVGAHISGLLVFAFGVGAFWLPVLLLLSAVWYFKGRTPKIMMLTFGGGLLLIISTGSILALFKSSYALFGTRFPAGGLVSTRFADFMLTYTSMAGTSIILVFLFIVGFILATGISFFSILAFCRRIIAGIFLKIGDAFRDMQDAVKEAFEERREKKAGEAQPETERSGSRPVRKNKGKNDAHEKAGGTADEGEALPDPVITQVEKKATEQSLFDMDIQDIRETAFPLPSVSFLNDSRRVAGEVDTEKLKKKSRILEDKLSDFNISGEVVEILPGPVITTFEYRPAPGIKISKIVNLADDLALALSATGIRIVAPIPGKDVIGIEIPNDKRELVVLKDLITSREFADSESRITLCIGKDILGSPVVASMDSMPHLLIAGATGTGKSVGLNAMIISLLYKASPDEVKFIMIDPKRIELSVYDGIPHLISPVVTDMKKATNALFWAVKEMERRYELLADKGARNIVQYNKLMDRLRKEKGAASGHGSEETPADAESLENLPYIVVIVDEFADLMMVSSKDVESAVTRLAQMARAAGMHLIMATQRPSVDVLTGMIKANFPTRISFQVSSKIDSRTILDANGSERLLGNGDMLFCPPGTGRLMRIQGPFVSEKEIEKITRFLKSQRQPEYVEDVTKSRDDTANRDIDEADYDEKYDEAVALVTRTRQASISGVQRHLRIGYNRAARIIETMEAEGVIGPSDGVKPREVLVRGYDD